MSEPFKPLTVADYAVQALRTDRGTDAGSMAFPLLGLFGETGSLLSEVKKKQRDKASYRGYAESVNEELGDVLWYLTVLAKRGGLPLSEIAANAGKNFSDWQNGEDPAITFAELQPEHMPQAQTPTPAFEGTLLKLAGDVGLLAMDFQAGHLDNNRAALAGRMVSVMRSLIHASTDAGVTLEAAALKNLHKIADRWPPPDRVYPEPIDKDAEPEERLPRDLYIDIVEREVRGEKFVFQTCNGINIGDRLNDNSVTADDYRFHDVFHYAYIAVLSWSPVMRALLRLKRKSDPLVDTAQDGARAILIEEGITTWIFGIAANLNDFDGVKVGDLPFDLLKDIRQFVKGYEAEECPLWLWEEAILQGYAAFRFLRRHRKGRIHIDMNNHRLDIEALP